MITHERIYYLEYAAVDLEATKAFFTAVFAWTFTDYSPDYTAFERQGNGVEGGFYRANLVSSSEQGAALAVFYSDDLEATQNKNRACWWEYYQGNFFIPRRPPIPFHRAKW